MQAFSIPALFLMHGGRGSVEEAASTGCTGLNGGRPVPIIRAAMHAHTASDRQPASSALDLRALSAAAIVAVTVSILGGVIIRPSARGVLG
jgi:hypothetical protein